MPTYERTRMCNECPFRACSPRGWLGPLTIEDLEDAVHGPRLPGTTCHVGDLGELICHKDVSKRMAAGEDEDEIAVDGQQCVGMIRYANSVCKLSHNAEVADYQRKLRSIEDQPVIAPFKLREHHEGRLLLQSDGDAATIPKQSHTEVGATMNDKLVPRVREMQKLLRMIEPKLTGKLRREVRDVLKDSETCVPKDNRIGRQLKFTEQTVKQAVEDCDGNKLEAAKLLGCSLRTVYTVLDRGDPKPKAEKRKAGSVDVEAMQDCGRMMVDVARTVIPKLRGRSRALLAEAADKCDDRLPSDRQPMFSVDEVRTAIAKCGGDKAAAAKKLGCSLSTIYSTLRRK